MSLPELKKKKAARDSALAKAAATAEATAKKESADSIKTITAKAKAYEAEYAALEKAKVDSRREAKAKGGIFVAPEEKIVLVIRIRGTIGVSPKVRKILQLFRLRQLHNATFVRVNAATEKMLRLIEPYIAYGYPNLKAVKSLIYKRGYGKLAGQRIPLSSNDVIKSAGIPGIECIEDVVHEIFTVGPEFKAVANFLWPFKLNSPTKGFRGKKLNHHNEGGQCGQQGTQINTLIKKML